MKKQSQIKPNFREAQMNATIFATRDYENESALRLRENKPNQSQFQTTEDRRQKPALLALLSLIVSGEAWSAAEWVRNDRTDKAQLLAPVSVFDRRHGGTFSANIEHSARL